MTHIAEVYAKDLGVKVGKPHIQDHFYPIVSEKYITLHTDTEIQSKQYDHWDLCISMLKKYLDTQGIKIVQIGSQKSKPTPGVDEFIPNGTFRNTNYIIKKSMLHLGIDSLPIHVASVYDIPIVGLYSHTYKETCYPYWSSEGQTELLSPDFSEIKPSFSTQESEKRINEIKPEDIVKAVLKKLNIKEDIKFKTIKAGQHYSNPLIEIIPNFFAFSSQLQNQNLTIRADMHYDEKNIHQWTLRNNVSIITKKVYPIELINKNVKQIVFYIDDIKDSEDLNKYFKLIRRKNIQLSIITKKEEFKDLQYKYFDHNVVRLPDPDKNTLKLITENTMFLTSKVVLSDGKQYKSLFSAKMLDNSDKFVLNNISKDELENFYLYE